MSKIRHFPRGAIAPAMLAAALTLAAMAVTPDPAMAQTSAETRVLIERMNRLESDLVGLQRQVFQGQPPPSARGAGSAPTGVPAAPGDVWSRMDEFESSLRRLTGQLEEVDHRIAVLQQRLDKLVEDVDYRLTALERGQAPGQGGALAPGQPPAAPPPGPPQPQPQAAPPPAGAPGPGVLGQLRVPPGQPVPGAEAPPPGAAPQPQPQQAAAAPPGAARPATRLPQGSPQDRYNFAIGLLRRGDFAEAEIAFTEFLAAHGNDPLAGNAQYWLGETYYVRRDFERSAAAFLQAYQKYPKGNKAPDSLVKLGMSLTQLNQKQEACAVFNQFNREHPQAPAPLKQLAATERTRAGCR